MNQKTPNTARHPASYRDPDGFVFSYEDVIYRALQPQYQSHYELLMSSGLYAALTSKKWLLSHTEVDNTFPGMESAWKILRPQQLPFISYPYEWSFEQLKSAALLTLRITETALQHGLLLKDATAYNIQFLDGRPVFIDTSSFEHYREGTSWQAFRQFCEHFFYPLLLQSKIQGIGSSWMLAYPEGIPASITASLLPERSKLNLNNWLYVYLPARLSNRPSTQAGKQLKLSKTRILQNIGQLKSMIGKLKLKTTRSEWHNYYSETIINNTYLQHKQELIQAFFKEHPAETVSDIGCNTGIFSRLASGYAGKVIALDPDILCVNELYRQGISNIFPIIADLVNPSPGNGWNNKERAPLLERITCDTAMALALVHHLAIGRNIPLELIIQQMAALTRRHLIIEFVPKEDPKVQLLLQARQDIFTDYTPEHFEYCLEPYFSVRSRHTVAGSDRTLFFLIKK